MSEFLRRWWPALPALIIAWLGGSAFVEKYPRPAEGSQGRAAAAQGPDSLLDGFRRKLAATSPAAGDSAALKADDPFRPIRALRPVAERRPGGRMTVPPPPRNFLLKGTVGSKVATIANQAGHKYIVKVGETIDSAVVISIEANKVVLKDRAGKFELFQER